MKGIFYCALSLTPNEGISKKIYAQAAAISSSLGKCTLISKEQSGSATSIVEFIDGQIETSNIKQISAIDYLKLQAESSGVDYLYVRHLNIPNFRMLSVLKIAVNRNIKIIYEIPTYPFFYEQIASSRKKVRAIAKVALNVVYLPCAYRYCDTVAAVVSDTTVHKPNKMIEVTNAADANSIQITNYSALPSDVFRIGAVGTLYPYHGYDRVLYGLSQCGEQIDGIPVEFHIIGESQTTCDLENLANKLNLKRVTFHGKKNSDELNEMFSQYHVGVGCLALFRKHANVDTSLKIIEYWDRGLPSVSCGRVPIDKEYRDTVIEVPADESPIDIRSIFEQCKSVSPNHLFDLARYSRARYTWENIMSTLLGKNHDSKDL